MLGHLPAAQHCWKSLGFANSILLAGQLWKIWELVPSEQAEALIYQDLGDPLMVKQYPLTLLHQWREIELIKEGNKIASLASSWNTLKIKLVGNNI